MPRPRPYSFGAKYSNGIGVPQDYKIAKEWFKKSAEQGHSGAQVSYRLMSEKGVGIPANRDEAIKWFQKGAEQGNPLAREALDRIREGQKSSKN